MSDVMFAMESGGTSTGVRKKPSLSIRGQRRKKLRDLARTLQTVLALDLRESARAERLGYDPFLFIGRVGSANQTAIQRLLDRVVECLAARG